MENRMNRIDIVEINLTDKVKNTRENCPANWLAENQLTYLEQEGVEVILTLEKDSLKIERKWENSTCVECSLNKRTEAKIKTEFGDFYFEVETDFLQINQDEIFVQYSLYQENERISQNRFYWTIKKENEEEKA